ncbi:MAG: DUF2062 domain-containing protein [Paracoccaceae bacterium]|nr:DUF2062 domain-containing protein [Paracoccaceae bacterium]
MVFKRRTKRSWAELAGASVYPKGGWSRAAQYVNHRLRRLPDAPHRIARGIFAGVFVSFTPLFGLHFTAAALIAILLRGNILAALMATFVGNPITFPIIAVSSVELGHWILGTGKGLPVWQIVAAFGQAGGEFWANIKAIFTNGLAHWDNLSRFFHEVYLPYLVGGTGPGLVAGLISYYLSLPLIGAYQKLRKKRLNDRIAKLRATKAARLAAEVEAKDDAGPGEP